MKIITRMILIILAVLQIANATEKEEVAKLYVATFNRAPDSAGLNYWVGTGDTLLKIASDFFLNSETQKLYPEGTPDRDFINSVYQNLFNRSPDTAGATYWEEDLKKLGHTREEFILLVIGGALDNDDGMDKTILDNKSKVGLYFANAGLGNDNFPTIVMSGIMADNSTVTFAKSKISDKALTSDMWDSWISWYTPDINSTWQWQISGSINTSYDVEIYDIDLFDSSRLLIETLKSKGKKVICYFSAGSYEDFREDKEDFPVDALGKDLDDWEGEKWLDIRDNQLKPIMKARLDLAQQKGCDGVEPDNMAGFENDTGFNLNADDQLSYNKFIVNEAHKRGLSVGLKNDINQIVQLEPYYDFSVNEQCHYYNECAYMQPFIDANKPVLNAEYASKYINNTNNDRDNMCEYTNNLQFQTLILPLELDDSFRYSCGTN